MSDIVTAVTALVNGQQVRRDSWPQGMWCFLAEDTKTIGYYQPNNTMTSISCLSFNTADFQATDWQTRVTP